MAGRPFLETDGRLVITGTGKIDDRFFHNRSDIISLEIGNSITNGVDATHFGPFQDCNRAQVVTFLYRTYVN